MNIVLLQGILNRPAQLRTMTNGDVLLSFDLRIEDDQQKAESVPVVYLNPKIDPPDVGEEVLVSGRVSRRFFQVGGSLQSRTEVKAESVVKARNIKRARAVVDQTSRRISQAA